MWREQKVRVRFSNAAGVKWQELDSRGPEERDDSVYEIVGSSWLAEYLANDARTSAEGLIEVCKHKKLYSKLITNFTGETNDKNSIIS